MKSTSIFLTVLLCMCMPLHALAQERKSCIDNGWNYIYGERADKPTDAEWSRARVLNVPHDWSVETDAATQAGKHVGPFICEGGDYQNGHMLGGEAWYRKVLRINEEDKDKDLTLYFEGVYNHATIFLNGRQVYFNHYGYQSFRVALPKDAIRYNAENEIVVKCENKGKNTRWYSGSGIFRHVWLMRTPDNLSLDEWHTFVSTENIKDAGGNARVKVVTELKVGKYEGKNINVGLTVVDASGKQVAESSVQITGVTSHSNPDVSFTVRIPDAHLWSADTPYIYKAVLTAGGDKIEIPFGVRTITCDTDKGLLVNGNPVLLKGGCVHHDHGLLGAASLDGAEIRKIELLKKYGFNAVRCSHNLPSEKFLQVCDSLGMYVIDECFDQWYEPKNEADYHNYFADHYLSDLSTMLCRDRNHPSVIMWSIGNEIPGRYSERGMTAARSMRDRIMRLDGTRPVIAALCYWDITKVDWKQDSWKVTQSLDIVGYNYMWAEYDNDAVKHNQLMCGTETYPKEASQNWDRVEKYSKIVGDFVWTAMDYLGEAGIGHGLFVKDGKSSPFFMPYPYYNGWCGDIDLIGNKKPQSYYRDVVWGIQPITMAVELPCPEGYHREISGWGWQPEVNAWEHPSTFFTPHNLPNIMFDGAGAQINSKQKPASTHLNVNVYSKAKLVRLYLNGKLIGTKPTSDTYHAGFEVDYEPGVLRAVELDGEKEGASFELKTAGKPARIEVKTEKYDNLIYATVTLVDKDGNRVADYERTVKFSAEGGGKVIATGNANPTDMESFRSNSTRLYNGQAMAVIQTDGSGASVKVTVKCQGIGSKKAEIFSAL